METWKGRLGPCHSGQEAHNTSKFTVSTSECVLSLGIIIRHLSSCQLKYTSNYLFPSIWENFPGYHPNTEMYLEILC